MKNIYHLHDRILYNPDFSPRIEGNGPDMQMTKENRLLVIIALVTSMMMVGLALVIRGQMLLKEITDFPGGWKIFLSCILLGFMTALISAFAYDVSEWIRKIMPVDVLLVVRELPVFLWIFIAVMGSCAEEIFFRGALQSLVGIIPTNVIFGFMHFMAQKRLLGYGISAFIIGLLLSLVYEWTGSLTGVMALHTTHNLVVSIWIRKRWADKSVHPT